jgi:hypothetical protein
MGASGSVVLKERYWDESVPGCGSQDISDVSERLALKDVFLKINNAEYTLAWER